MKLQGVDQFELDSFDQPAVALMLGSQRNDTEFPVHSHRKGQLVVAYHGGIVCTVEDARSTLATRELAEAGG